MEGCPVSLVVREPACHVCGGPVGQSAWTQLPLLRHGGYGEATRSVVARCQRVGCGASRAVAETAENPRHAAR